METRRGDTGQFGQLPSEYPRGTAIRPRNYPRGTPRRGRDAPSTTPPPPAGDSPRRYEAAAAALQAAGAPAPLIAPAAGVATGVACSVVRVPLSVAKSRVQLNLAPSAFAALVQAWRAGGPAGLYVGFGATLALDVAVAVVQFSTLDAGRKHLGGNQLSGPDRPSGYRTGKHLDIASSALLGFLASGLSTARGARARFARRVRGGRVAAAPRVRRG